MSLFFRNHFTGAIRGSSREKLYKILKSQSLKYLYLIILIHNMSYRTRQCNKVPAINVKYDLLKNSFFSFNNNGVK